MNKTILKTIICDLDGTLCLLNGRDPYDATLCEQDLPNEPVLGIVKKYYYSITHKVIFVSGRKDTWKNETFAWLAKHISPDLFAAELHMRKADDNRKDSVVKQEIYDEYIKGQHEIDFVLDDRQQVVDMWRANGLTCLQVAPGNF